MTGTTTIGHLTEQSIVNAMLAYPEKFGDILLRHAEELQKVLPTAIPIDPKTGLLHGLYFETVKLPEYLRRAYQEQKSFAYILYDINDLGEINQNPRYGKSIGDLVVQGVAKGIENFFGLHMPDSAVARVDYGDEFAVATFGKTNNYSFAHIYIIAEDALKKISKKAEAYVKEKSGVDLEVGVKAGIIEVNPPNLGADEVKNKETIRRYIDAIKDCSERAIQTARYNTKTIEIGQFTFFPKIIKPI